MVAVTDSRPAGKAKGRQVVFSFDEGAPETRTSAIRGGKGAYLAEMTALGLPVPPGFTVSTTAVRAFQEHEVLPRRFGWQFKRAITKLERQSGKELGNPGNPLLVSVRSGAQASMPGMMDTVLNVGLNPSNVEGLVKLQGERFAYDAYRRFLCQFGAVVLGVSSEKIEYIMNGVDVTDAKSLSQVCEYLRMAIELELLRPVPDDPRDQLYLCLDAVMRSWQSERAAAYRRANSLPEWWGTAVNVQQMVFGNRSDASGTGVAFSHDLTTGREGFCGEFLPNAQGEDVVAGTHTPWPIADMQQWNEQSYFELKALVYQLSDHMDDMVDVEFTVEDGQLFLLQVRRAKRTALATITHLVRKVWDGQLRREDAVEAVAPSVLESLLRSELDVTDDSSYWQGLAASPGGAVGRVVTTSAEAVRRADNGETVILVTRDTTPDDLPGMLKAAAIVTANGGMSCHAAMVARDLGLPAVVGMGDRFAGIIQSDTLSVDGTSGRVYVGQKPLLTVAPTKELRIFEQWSNRFAAYQPRIGFEWMEREVCVNVWLNDFYLSERMAAEAAGTLLEQKALQLEKRTRHDAAEMLVCYLMIAVAGEIQYAYGREIGGRMRRDRLARLGVHPTLTQSHLPSQVSVARTLGGLTLAEQSEYFRLATDVFDDPGWNGAVGGAKWARIAEAGHQFLTGACSPRGFVDHVFDLRHNGGRLFDKHDMVTSLTSDGLVLQQLEVKKRAVTTRELHADLRLFSPFSTPVEELYQQGLHNGLW